MKTLQIDEKNARALYKGAPKEFKTTLEDTFGKDFFSGKITDRIKTFEDACAELELYPEDVIAGFQETASKDEIAYRKLKIIAKALNEGWKPDWTDSNQYKYFPWLEYSRSGSGFVFSGTDCARTAAYAAIGSRLCFKSKELALYIGEQFIDLYNEYLN